MKQNIYYLQQLGYLYWDKFGVCLVIAILLLVLLVLFMLQRLLQVFGLA